MTAASHLINGLCCVSKPQPAGLHRALDLTGLSAPQSASFWHRKPIQAADNGSWERQLRSVIMTCDLYLTNNTDALHYIVYQRTGFMIGHAQTAMISPWPYISVKCRWIWANIGSVSSCCALSMKLPIQTLRWNNMCTHAGMLWFLVPSANTNL